LHLDVDITSPHRYYNAHNAATGGLDPSVGYLTEDIAKWKAEIPDKIILYGEAGVQNPYNYDPEGYRIWLWTSLFNEAGLIFWNTSYKKTFASNQYMGPEERAFSKIFAGYIEDFDGAARPVEVGLSRPEAVRAYALTSEREAAIYFQSRDFTTRVSGVDVMIDVPRDGVEAEWFDPATGNMLGHFPVGRDAQRLRIPDFSVDLVLRIRAAGSVCTDPPGIPAGFAAPCPVLTVTPSQAAPSGELMISASAPAGAESNILSTFYLFNAGKWLPVAVPGAMGWCNGSCSATLPAGTLKQLTPGSHAVSSWDWTWNGHCWVGPGSNACGQGNWRYQTFTIQ
jgi:hypothetical protein